MVNMCSGGGAGGGREGQGDGQKTVQGRRDIRRRSKGRVRTKAGKARGRGAWGGGGEGGTDGGTGIRQGCSRGPAQPWWRWPPDGEPWGARRDRRGASSFKEKQPAIAWRDRGGRVGAGVGGGGARPIPRPPGPGGAGGEPKKLSKRVVEPDGWPAHHGGGPCGFHRSPKPPRARSTSPDFRNPVPRRLREGRGHFAVAEVKTVTGPRGRAARGVRPGQAGVTPSHVRYRAEILPETRLIKGGAGRGGKGGEGGRNSP